MLVDFCLPAFNEEKIIKENVSKLLAYCQENNLPFAWQITILNNNSTDRTRELSLGLVSDQVKYYENNIPGRGSILKEYWLESEADVLAYMDCDLAVSLEAINDLIGPIINNEADLVVGSRRLKEANYSRSIVRDWSSKVFLFLSRLILKNNFTDLQCGFKAVRASSFREVSDLLFDRYWFFDTEMMIFLQRRGGRVKEIPVNWRENRFEKRKSKVNFFQDSFVSLANLFKLKKRLVKIHENKI